MITFDANYYPLFELKSIPPILLPKLRSLFSQNHQVDLAIPAVLEGQTGPCITIKVDNLIDPVAAQIEHGTFTVFAGSPDKTTAAPFIAALKGPCGIQPSPAQWLEWIKVTWNNRIQVFKRYTFSHHHLEKNKLQALIARHPLKNNIQKIDLAIATRLRNDDWGRYHFLNYHSAAHFIEQSTGYCIMEGDVIAAACTAALVCSKGIEMNIITHPEFRKKGLATIVAASMITDCLEKGLEPHWDAANDISKTLALKLGYKEAGSYDIVVYK